MYKDKIEIDAEEAEFIDDDDNENDDRISIHYEQVRVHKVSSKPRD